MDVIPMTKAAATKWTNAMYLKELETLWVSSIRNACLLIILPNAILIFWLSSNEWFDSEIKRQLTIHHDSEQFKPFSICLSKFAMSDCRILK